MVLCFHHREGICQTWVNPPATIRKGELSFGVLFVSETEGCKGGYLEWGCRRARWGEIHEPGTYQKLQSIGSHQRRCSLYEQHESCLSISKPPDSPMVFSPSTPKREWLEAHGKYYSKLWFPLRSQSRIRREARKWMLSIAGKRCYIIRESIA